MKRMAELLMCDCGDPMHHFIIRYGEINGRRVAYFNVVLQRDISLPRRLYVAMRYAFGRYACKYGNMAEVVLSHDSYGALKRIAEYLSEDVSPTEEIQPYPESRKEQRTSALLS